jgi:hypothetical protein
MVERAPSVDRRDGLDWGVGYPNPPGIGREIVKFGQICRKTPKNPKNPEKPVSGFKFTPPRGTLKSTFSGFLGPPMLGPNQTVKNRSHVR